MSSSIQIHSQNQLKSRVWGFLGSFVSCVALLLFMWFYIMPLTNIPQPVEEEGLMVSFGDNENAGGMGSSDIPLAAPKEEVISHHQETKPQTSPTSKEHIITQNSEENAINIRQQKELKEKQNAIQKQKEIEHQQAIQKQKEQDAINRANATVNGLFSNGSMKSGTGNGKGSGNGTGTGSGNGSEAGVQGNPAGHGNLGGNSWSLNGRSLYGKLATPSYDNDVEGKVTVSIRVDENGNVVSANVVSPTTISDSQTRNAAITAAKNTHFSKGNGIVSGTIVYNFRLK